MEPWEFEATKFKLSYEIPASFDLILERFRSYTIISTVAFAAAGISLSNDFVKPKNLGLAIVSLLGILFIAVANLYIYIFSFRPEIMGMHKRFNDLTNIKSQRAKTGQKEFKLDYWPEVSFCSLVLFIALLLRSFFWT